MACIDVYLYSDRFTAAFKNKRNKTNYVERTRVLPVQEQGIT